ncbi:hypothetical protein KDH_43660 [Dictyobacter sp. S3.2.2.5]|uniref:FPG-type domain-containing protein n=1 Tax=Dictyobacter halimunensis TaxID=3026934 RepID=A0ABQ6FUR2_9CHLR|nr:hypothetical protein KDH_43660 [Dictyobacter sp. S3.2.2.5]
MKQRMLQDDGQYIKQPKHARISLHSVWCQDCGRELRITHLVHLFGGQCRACWSALHINGANVEVVS